jgi:hypothetical protein
MKFSIDIKLEVDQKQFNFHINKVYDGKIHSIVPFDGKVTITGDFTLAEKTEIENYYISLPLFEEDYVITQLMNGYEKKQKDGHNYYNLKRSELVESIITAVRTEAEAFEIDTKLVNVKNALLTGDWKTAQTYLGLTVVEGAYTQSLKDEFDTEIQDYINANY